MMRKQSAPPNTVMGALLGRAALLLGRAINVNNNIGVQIVQVREVRRQDRRVNIRAFIRRIMPTRQNNDVQRDWWRPLVGTLVLLGMACLVILYLILTDDLVVHISHGLGDPKEYIEKKGF